MNDTQKIALLMVGVILAVFAVLAAGGIVKIQKDYVDSMVAAENEFDQRADQMAQDQIKTVEHVGEFNFYRGAFWYCVESTKGDVEGCNAFIKATREGTNPYEGSIPDFVWP